MSTTINGNPALVSLNTAVPKTASPWASGASGSQSTSSVFGPGGSFSQLVMALEQSGAAASAAGTASTSAASTTASAAASASATGSSSVQQAVQNFLSTLKQSLGAQASSPTAVAATAGTAQNPASQVHASHHGHHHGGGGGSSLLSSLLSGGTDSSSGSSGATSTLPGTATAAASWQAQAQKSSASALAAAHGRLLGVV
jgi:hypothetical protein